MLAFPTETFYGLGCCADQALAVARVYQAKRRPVHMPLPLLAGSLDLLRPYVTLEQAPEALLAAFWPGPLTVVLAARLTPLEGRRPLAPQLVNPRGKAAVRLTPHPLAARLSCLAACCAWGPSVWRPCGARASRRICPDAAIPACPDVTCLPTEAEAGPCGAPGPCRTWSLRPACCWRTMRHWRHPCRKNSPVPLAATASSGI